jgi:ABC-type antimicrobial peptide transport system permease subunit
MSDIKAKDLIQAKVLGCLDPEDEVTFSKMIEDDKDFPWQEFGQYQNIVSHLPILLDTEIPDQEVKNNISKKLLELTRLKKEAEVVEEVATVGEEIDKNIIIEDDVELEISDDREIEENKSKKDISFKDHGVLQSTLGNNISSKNKSNVEHLEKEITDNQTSAPKKESNRKNVRSHISKSPAYIEPPAQNNYKKGTITSIILFIIALIALIVVYFTLSSDIQDNKDEIERLKEQLYSGMTVESYYLNDCSNS